MEIKPGRWRTTGSASASTSSRTSARCGFRRSGPPRSPSSTATSSPRAEERQAALGLHRHPHACDPPPGLPRRRPRPRVHQQLTRRRRPSVHERTSQEPGTIWTAGPAPDVPRRWPVHTGCYAFFHLAAYTGARRGELLNLRWPDVDLDGKQITIKGSAGVVDGQRHRGHHEERPDARGQHRRQHGRRSPRTPEGPGRREAPRRRVLEGRRERHVFTTAWGGPIYPDHRHRRYRASSSRPTTRSAAEPLPTIRCTTYGTSTRPRCSWRASPSTSSPLGSATPTRRSPSGSTPT